MEEGLRFNALASLIVYNQRKSWHQIGSLARSGVDIFDI